MNQVKKSAPKLSSKQQDSLKGKTVSDQIRYLNSEGFTRADIARALKKRYQHVRNVLIEDERKAESQD